MSLLKQRTIKSNKIRASARGEDCLVRIPGVCNFDPATTVLAHINGGGAGMKQDDIEAAYCCSSCHDVLDGRANSDFTKSQLDIYHYQAAHRTRKKLFAKDLLKIC